MFMDEPRSLRHPAVREARLRMLESEAAYQPLREWNADLVARRNEKQPGTVVPHFDPAEGGVAARVLLVHEAPGPMTNADNKRPGSGFISVDNDDRSAAMVWQTRKETGMDHGVLGWNIVPWYLGVASVKPTADWLREGALELRRLLAILPEVRVVVTSGLVAQRGWNRYIAPHVTNDIAVIQTWHPSPLAMLQPGKQDDLRRAYERAARLAF